jgi:glutamyl-tRNA synthetase
MKWLGLDWDEGPYRQVDRFDIYRNYARQLLKEGKAYYCYCSSEELEKRRQEALVQGKSPKYDGRCRDVKGPVMDRMPAIRFMMPQVGETVVDDLIRGKVVFDNAQLDDLIILRSDGSPTYNFCVVVDDVDMNITHVIRGDDHLNNTPKQIHIYRSLGYTIPAFAHLPMILGSDKTRLSKRHGATSVTAYKEMGYLSDAFINYLARLGWAHGDQEIFTRDEMVEYFSLEDVGKSAAVFNPEKLLWLNSQYIKNTPSERLVELVMPFLMRESIVQKDQVLDNVWLSKAIDTLKERAKTLLELAHSLRFYIVEDTGYDEKAKAKFLNQKSLPYLVDVLDAFKKLDSFIAPDIEKVFSALVGKHNIKLGNLAQPVRVAVTGKAESPGIFEVLEVLGKEKVLKRLEKVIKEIG